MISKPATATKPPNIYLDSDTLASRTLSKGSEIIAIHYLNTTSGVGRVDICDGSVSAMDRRITLGAAVVSGTDSFEPSQPFTFVGTPIIVFTTGTGVVTILRN